MKNSGLFLLTATLALQPMAASKAQEVHSDSPSRSTLEGVVTTGTRLLESNQAVDIDTIDADLIQARRNSSVTDLLRQVPGIDIAQPGGAGAAELFIRGAESNFTTVLIDGVKVNNPTNDRGGSFDFATVNVDEIERIEVVRGPLSAIYGSDALSGAVNIITRSPSESRSMSASGEIGPHDYRRAYLNASGAFDDRRAGSLHATQWNTGETVNGYHSELTAFQGGIGYAGEESSGKLKLRHTSSTRSAFPAASGGPLFAESHALESNAAEEWLLSARADRRIDDRWTAGFIGSSYERSEDIETPAILADGVVAVPAADSASRFRFDQGILHSGLAVTDQLQLDAGVEFRHETGRRSGTLDFEGLILPSSFELDRSTYAVFAEGAFSTQWGGEIFASLRGDDPEDANSRLSTKLAFSYLHDETGIRLTASWAEGFKLPSFYALGDSFVGNPDLKAETGDTLELRVALPIFEGKATLEVAAYESQYLNLIDFDFDSFHLVNRSEVKISGADISFAFAAHADLQFDAHVGYMDIEVTPGVDTLRFRPKWRGGLSAIWQPTSLWTVQANMKSVGARLASSIPTGGVILEAYERLDFSVSRHVGPHLTMTTAIDNVLGADYQEDAGVPAPGLMVRVGAHVTF